MVHLFKTLGNTWSGFQRSAYYLDYFVSILFCSVEVLNLIEKSPRMEVRDFSSFIFLWNRESYITLSFTFYREYF